MVLANFASLRRLYTAKPHTTSNRLQLGLFVLFAPHRGGYAGLRHAEPKIGGFWDAWDSNPELFS